MTAKQAAEVTSKIEESIFSMQMEKIDAAIRSSAQGGMKSCTMSFMVLSKVKEALEDMEYIVIIGDDFREGTYTTIKW